MAKSQAQDLTQNFQHRLVALEIELKDLARLGHISSGQYQKRAAKLSALKTLLSEQRKRAQADDEKIARLLDPWDIPSQFFLEPQMYTLCGSFYQQLITTLKDLVKESAWIARSVQKTLNNHWHFEWFKLLRLSRLRQRLIRLENKNTQLARDQKGRMAYARTVIKVAAQENSRANISLIDQLKEIAQTWREDEIRLGRLKEQVERQKDQLNWMEQWLGYQEQRFARFVPKSKAAKK